MNLSETPFRMLNGVSLKIIHSAFSPLQHIKANNNEKAPNPHSLCICIVMQEHKDSHVIQ